MKSQWLFAILVTFCAAALAFYPDSRASAAPAKDRASILLSKALPKSDGEHLKATLVEVRYGPGESSPPHSHACPVLAYVVEGSIRMRVNREAEQIYKAGDSFYEGPNGVHAVSANASAAEPAKFVALLICDHETPLSVNLPDSNPKGNEQ